jgi:hypothetical protein
VRRDGVDDLVRAAPAEHAGGGGADLDKVVADRFPVRAGKNVVSLAGTRGPEGGQADRLNLTDGDTAKSADGFPKVCT